MNVNPWDEFNLSVSWIAMDEFDTIWWNDEYHGMIIMELD
jgi:hypothetical protein